MSQNVRSLITEPPSGGNSGRRYIKKCKDEHFETGGLNLLTVVTLTFQTSEAFLYLIYVFDYAYI